MNTKKLEQLNACPEAIEWCREQKSQAAAWATCGRGDWMLWLLGMLAGPPETKSRKKLVLCCADVAALALPYAGQNRGIGDRTITVVRAYGNGDATIDEVRNAFSYASKTTSAAYAAYAAYASKAAHAAASTAYAAYAAYASKDDRQTLLLDGAKIVRKHYPQVPRIRIVNKEPQS